MIELVGISKSYPEAQGRRVILDDLSLSVSPGQRIALVGKSGSGKSTLLNLLAGIDLPDRGQVTVAGQDLAQLDERGRTLFRRRRIGFVFQFFNLLPTLTVAENVRLPLELNGLDEPDRVDALLDRVGLLERSHSYPDKLSGGEQQRVAVARALVHRPALVLADEPTGNLDAETGASVLELLAEMATESNQTMVMATHSREASQSTDRVYSMRAGRLE
ncbi:MAG: ABC transporter ATP-binding protein [Vulcanimicrobiota bacterium]